MNKHVDIRVTGLVQGVWFRKSTKEKASSLGLSGFVRNEPDGSVYIEAEGGPEAIAELIKWCGDGPPLARVERVEPVDGTFQGFIGFEVR